MSDRDEALPTLDQASALADAARLAGTVRLSTPAMDFLRLGDSLAQRAVGNLAFAQMSALQTSPYWSAPSWLTGVLQAAEARRAMLSHSLYTSSLRMPDLGRLTDVLGLQSGGIARALQSASGLGGAGATWASLPSARAFHHLSHTTSVLEQVRGSALAKTFAFPFSESTSGGLTATAGLAGRTASAFATTRLATRDVGGLDWLTTATRMTGLHTLANEHVLTGFAERAMQLASLKALAPQLDAVQQLTRGVESLATMARATSAWWDVATRAQDGLASLSPWLRVAPTLQPYTAARLLSYFAELVKLSDEELEELVADGVAEDAEALYAMLMEEFLPRLASVRHGARRAGAGSVAGSDGGGAGPHLPGSGLHPAGTPASHQRALPQGRDEAFVGRHEMLTP